MRGNGGQKNKAGAKSDIMILLVILASVFPLKAQEGFMDRYVQNGLDVEAGLPCNYIDDILRDDAGFLWIATSGGGLCRWDGYDILTLSSASPTPLKSNFIRNLCEDNFHRLWIGSEGGLDLLDLSTLKPQELPHPSLEAIGYSFCSFLTRDARGDIWIKTGNTLYKTVFNPEGDIERVLSFTHEGLNQENLVCKDMDRDGTVWVGIQGHLWKIGETTEGTLGATPLAPGFQYGTSTYLSDFLEDGAGAWVSTETGLYLLQPRTGEWKYYAHTPADPRSLTQNFQTGLARTADNQVISTSLYGFNVYHPFTDNFERVGDEVINCIRVFGQDILLGTENAGLLFLTPKRLGVTNFIHSTADPSSLAGGPVNAVLQQEDGRLWVGTQEGGLSIREPGANGFGHLTTANSALSHNSVSALREGPDGQIIIGTWGGGVDLLSGRKPWRILRHISDPGGLLHYAGAVEYDTRNQLVWIGSNRGVFFWDPSSDVLTPALEVQATGCIGSCLDSSERLWMGCREGLYVFDLSRRNPDGSFPFTHYPYKLDTPDSRTADKICCILEASDRTLWLGSNGGGVYKCVTAEDSSLSFHCYSNLQGLSSDRVRGLCEDRNGKIWISTEHGLNRLDPVSERISSFFTVDGLENNQFFWNNAFNGTDGLLYFGHVGGLSVIDPLQISAVTDHVPLRFTEIRIGEREIRNPWIRSVKLHERDRGILFQFALPGQNTIAKASYEYKLEGFDEGWSRVPPSRHEAWYSALPAGHFRLLVRTLPESLQQAESLSLPVTVVPYFYKTWWFTLLLIALLAGLVYGGAAWRMRSIMRQRAELQRTVEERTCEISQQKRLVEEKAEELARQNRILSRQNEELAGHRILFAQERRPAESPRDEQFTAKVLEVVRSQYKDPDLDVAAFCSAMGMSKTLLNKRLQETMGQSIGQFIRTYRLTVAREILASNQDMNISEIAYEVGFNDPKYFTRCFSKEFGLSPSSFPKK